MNALQQWARDRVRALVNGDPAVRWEALRVEASHRRFYRLHLESRSDAAGYVVMSSPPDLENNAQFVALAALFRSRDVGVPTLLATDEARGFFLMTDLGETHFDDVYRTRGPAAVLPGALSTLHRLQQIHDPRIPPYTHERFEDELDLYSTWFLEALLDVAPSSVPAAVLAALVEATAAQPTCCVHRDFHCRNLLWTAAGDVGVVDFQDALMGPATYDLASLLRDCYYRFPEAEVARWRDAWLDATPLDVDRQRFARDLDFTALQRQLKAIGIFARLHLRDGRDTHLQHIEPVLNRIGDLAEQYRETRPLADHVAAILPRARQRLSEPA